MLRTYIILSCLFTGQILFGSDLRNETHIPILPIPAQARQQVFIRRFNRETENNLWRKTVVATAVTFFIGGLAAGMAIAKITQKYDK